MHNSKSLATSGQVGLEGGREGEREGGREGGRERGREGGRRWEGRRGEVSRKK